MTTTLEKNAAEDTAKTNRMDRRRLATRAKLLDATTALIEKKGVDKTTMDDITDAADLGRRTLYYHFGSKEECIIAAATRQYRDIAARADESAHRHEDTALAMAVASQLVVKALLDAPITSRLTEHPRLLGQAIRQSINEHVALDIKLGIEQGRIKPVCGDALLFTSAMWLLVGLIIETVENELNLNDALTDFSKLLLVTMGIPAAEADVVALKAASLLK